MINHTFCYIGCQNGGKSEEGGGVFGREISRGKVLQTTELADKHRHNSAVDMIVLGCLLILFLGARKTRNVYTDKIIIRMKSMNASDAFTPGIPR